jgi:hypothetical protein
VGRLHRPRHEPVEAVPGAEPAEKLADGDALGGA